MSWIFLGWLMELLLVGPTGRLSDALHWQEPVVLVVAGVGLGLDGRVVRPALAWLLRRQ
jgi:hypothetical protein